VRVRQKETLEQKLENHYLEKTLEFKNFQVIYREVSA